MLWAAAVIMTIFLALNACLTAAVVEMSRVTKIEDTGTTLTKTGTLVTVGQQQTVLPLSSMLYLPRVFRSQLEHLTVKLKSAGGTEVDMKVRSIDFSPAPAPDRQPLTQALALTLIQALTLTLPLALTRSNRPSSALQRRRTRACHARRRASSGAPTILQPVARSP